VAARYGGPSVAAVQTCLALQRAGLTVGLVTTDSDGPGRMQVRTDGPVQREGVPTLFFRRQWSEAFKYSGPLARWLRGHVSEYDVVHIHGVFSHCSLAAAASCRRRGVPYVVRPLGTLDPWSLTQKPWRKRLAWSLAARRMVRSAAAVHYTSRGEMRRTEAALGIGRGVVIPLGLDDEVFERPARDAIWKAPDEPFLLYLARLHPKKNPELLLRAFGAIQGQLSKPWRLLMAGDGDPRYVEDLRRLSQGCAPPGSVVFLGWLEGETKWAALQGASLYVLPSSQENFGLSVAEAMACGVPVVVSTGVDLAVDVLEAGAGWVIPVDQASLEKALTEALASESERRRRGAAAAALARRAFRWPAVAAALKELYLSVCVAGRTRA